jgi:NadR type nicotinamide-nucleotide adenylyltransferase
MKQRIAITGPESTGKSWLAEKLATHFGTVWVPEYARQYLHDLQRPYTMADVERIAEEQFRLNSDAARVSRLSFADTEMLVCSIWCEVVFGQVPGRLKQLLKEQEFDYYLLCDVDLEWTPDPLREHPDRRQEIFGRYLEQLDKLKLPYGIVRGAGGERLSNALTLLNDHFTTRI